VLVVALGRSLGRSEQAQEERGRRVRVCVRCWSPRRGEKGALKCKASSLSAQLREYSNQAEFEPRRRSRRAARTALRSRRTVLSAHGTLGARPSCARTWAAGGACGRASEESATGAWSCWTCPTLPTRPAGVQSCVLLYHTSTRVAGYFTHTTDVHVVELCQLTHSTIMECCLNSRVIFCTPTTRCM